MGRDTTTRGACVGHHGSRSQWVSVCQFAMVENEPRKRLCLWGFPTTQDKPINVAITDQALPKTFSAPLDLCVLSHVREIFRLLLAFVMPL